MRNTFTSIVVLFSGGDYTFWKINRRVASLVENCGVGVPLKHQCKSILSCIGAAHLGVINNKFKIHRYQFIESNLILYFVYEFSITIVPSQIDHLKSLPCGIFSTPHTWTIKAKSIDLEKTDEKTVKMNLYGRESGGEERRK